MQASIDLGHRQLFPTFGDLARVGLGLAFDAGRPAGRRRHRCPARRSINRRLHAAPVAQVYVAGCGIASARCVCRLLPEYLHVSGHQNCSANEPSGAQIGERQVGVAQGVAGGLGDDADLWRHTQKIETVLAGEIGNRYQLSLLP